MSSRHLHTYIYMCIHTHTQENRQLRLVTQDAFLREKLIKNILDSGIGQAHICCPGGNNYVLGSSCSLRAAPRHWLRNSESIGGLDLPVFAASPELAAKLLSNWWASHLDAAPPYGSN